jgi:hypothetical protein
MARPRSLPPVSAPEGLDPAVLPAVARLILGGCHPADAARQAGVSRALAYRWHHRLRRGMCVPRRGRPRRVAQAVVDAVASALLRGAPPPPDAPRHVVDRVRALLAVRAARRVLRARRPRVARGLKGGVVGLFYHPPVLAVAAVPAPRRSATTTRAGLVREITRLLRGASSWPWEWWRPFVAWLCRVPRGVHVIVAMSGREPPPPYVPSTLDPSRVYNLLSWLPLEAVLVGPERGIRGLALRLWRELAILGVVDPVVMRLLRTIRAGTPVADVWPAGLSGSSQAMSSDVP